MSRRLLHSISRKHSHMRLKLRLTLAKPSNGLKVSLMGSGFSVRGVLFLFDYGHESSDTKVHILKTKREVGDRASV